MTTLHIEDCPEDVIRGVENETRCALATLVAIEALRNDGETNWWDGAATDILGHFDNLLASARVLADCHSELLAYVRQESAALEAGWQVKFDKWLAAHKAEHPTEEPATT